MLANVLNEQKQPEKSAAVIEQMLQYTHGITTLDLLSFLGDISLRANAPKLLLKVLEREDV